MRAFAPAVLADFLDAARQALLKLNTPASLRPPARPGEGLPSVAIDNVAAAKAAFEYLYDLGHRDIWLVVNSSAIWNSKQRIDGFKAAARRKKTAGARVIEVGMTPQDTAKNLLAELHKAQPTAILTASGIATLGTLRAVHDKGLSIPSDLSLLGFDDAPWMDVLRPSISVVAQPIEAIAGRAWDLMHAELESSAPANHVLLDATIIERESTKRI